MSNKNEIDDVIKNPKRSASVNQKKYEPEYVRLNREPVPVNSSSEMYATVDDVSFDVDGQAMPLQDGHVIDNNEFVNFDMPHSNSAPLSQKEDMQEKEVDAAASPAVGDYILMVFGKLLMSGQLMHVEARVKSIIYGEDSSFDGKNVNINDIVVLKRVGIKVGVFVEV